RGPRADRAALPTAVGRPEAARAAGARPGHGRSHPAAGRAGRVAGRQALAGAVRFADRARARRVYAAGRAARSRSRRALRRARALLLDAGRAQAFAPPTLPAFAAAAERTYGVSLVPRGRLGFRLPGAGARGAPSPPLGAAPSAPPEASS